VEEEEVKERKAAPRMAVMK